MSDGEKEQPPGPDEEALRRADASSAPDGDGGQPDQPDAEAQSAADRTLLPIQSIDSSAIQLSHPPPPSDDGDLRPRTAFPIVGVGASAGGLEALEKLFGTMPPDIGIAFVLVQHSAPGRENLLVELLRRFAALPIVLVTSGMELEPNHIYVIPAGWDALLQWSKLVLVEPKVVSGVRLSIDTFFRSLAASLRERAICIILSGAGSDGSQGLAEIKEQGGLAIVQSPISALHEGMPRSAIETELVDYILRPEEIPSQLISYIHKEFLTGQRPVEPHPAAAESVLRRVFTILQRQSGHDFSLYKPNTINRRIARRMTVNQIERIDDYARFLENHPLEVDVLFRELLIGVTSFFRDSGAFASLAEQVIPRLFANRPSHEPIRIWVPGCSTGEEAYSIAMLLRERMEVQGQEHETQIFATDIDPQAIERARQGVYPENIVADVPLERIKRFFLREDSTFQISKRIRDMVVFAVQSVVKDPPFSRLDLISCRNLLIYLTPELQRKVISVFHYALKPEGFLFLGTSETLGEVSGLFTSIDRKWAIFQRPLSGPGLLKALEMASLSHTATPARLRAGLADATNTIRELTELALLKRYAPSCAVINEQGEIFYTQGRTGLYLEPSVGDMSTNILRMAREGLQLPLATALRKVALSRQETVYKGVQVKTNGDTQIVNLILEPMSERGMILVIFEHAPALPLHELSPASDEGLDEHDTLLRQLQQELQSTREYLQVTIEELEASNEEIKSANEELQSSNEELQSTNEELETSKEELQSMHEEQMTINTELRTKIEQLSRANNDLKNLLASIEIGTLFLDMQLCIVRFTPSARGVINVRESDIGRPLSDLVINVGGEDLIQQAQKVLDTLVTYAAEFQTRDGEWYWMRIMPYRTVENVIDGVIMTFSNITQQKQVQEQLPRLKQMVEKSSTMVIMATSEEMIEYVNPRLVTVTGYAAKEIIGQTLRMLLPDQTDTAQYEDVWKTVTAGREWQGELRHRKKSGVLYWVTASFSPMRDNKGNITQVVIVEEDITERKQAEAARQRMNHLLTALGNWHRLLAETPDEQIVLTVLCRLLVEAGNYHAAWIGLVGPDAPLHVQPVASAGYEDGYLNTLDTTWLEGEQPQSMLYTVLRTGQPSTVYYTPNDASQLVWQETARQRGFNAIITLAVREQERTVGVLQVHALKQDTFDVHEITMLQIIVDNIAYALRRLREG